MAKKAVIPHNWQVPDTIRARFAEIPGTQRVIEAEGHLLFILHELPSPDDAARNLRLFWRAVDGTWKSDGRKVGMNALESHLTEYAERVQELEQAGGRAQSAYDYYRLQREISPLHRAADNMYATLAGGHELCPEDRGLISCRNQAATIERAAQLLKEDAQYGQGYAMAKQTELQAEASHRLNVLAAVFFPVLTLSSIFGMTLSHGFEQLYEPWLFWLLLTVGISTGLCLRRLILKKTTYLGSAMPIKQE